MLSMIVQYEYEPDMDADKNVQNVVLLIGT